MYVNHGTVPDNNMPFGGEKIGVGVIASGQPPQFLYGEHAAYMPIDPDAICPTTSERRRHMNFKHDVTLSGVQHRLVQRVG